jgi:hypothetical protein
LVTPWVGLGEKVRVGLGEKVRVGLGEKVSGLGGAN